uniref:Nucleolar and spindle associated protein 1 n=1 Tax=Hucho hucho TaxID=62062 RepID=A0A4W5L555_9TELE
MDLDSMKYSELRSLAKKVGLKSSKLKADKLLKALKEHLLQQQQQQQQQQTEEDVAVDGDETGVDAQENMVNSNSTQNSVQVDELSPKPPSLEFVTKRRGRGQPKMRKEPEDEEAECEPAKAPLTPAEVVNKVTESIIGKGSAKRKRVSAPKDPVVAVPAPVEGSKVTNIETQPETKVTAVTFGVGQKVVKPVGKIPRHEGLLKRTMLKPTTPNFRKLHEAHFKRMESIDSYVERKTKKMGSFRNSVNELKVISDKTLLTTTEGKTQASSTSSRASLFSPASQKPATDRRRLTQVSASKPATDKRRLSARKHPQKDTVVPFRPTVLSTRRINVRFSQATRDNEHKNTVVKTPARVSLRVDLLTPGKETTFGGKPEVNKTFVLSSAKTPAFVFNANTSVLSNCPETNKKANFDLKASLSKTLTYKPHKGKLKPYMVAKENTVDQSQTIPSHQKNYKQRPVQAREERRTKQTEVRKQKKEKMLGARRGLVLT